MSALEQLALRDDDRIGIDKRPRVRIIQHILGHEIPERWPTCED
jgi:hypothetical protein